MYRGIALRGLGEILLVQMRPMRAMRPGPNPLQELLTSSAFQCSLNNIEIIESHCSWLLL